MFKNILWCPIDIPKFPIKNFNPTTESDWADWQFLKLTKRKNSPYDVSEISQDTRHKFPELVDWLNYFPYKNIRNIKFNIQKTFVTDHTDFDHPDQNIELYKNNFDNEPCGYRIIIAGKRNNSMYVVNNGKKIYTELPEETDTYVLGHTTTIHGVDFEPGRRTMFLHFEIDPDKNIALLEKSFDKYGKYAILKTS